MASGGERCGPARPAGVASRRRSRRGEAPTAARVLALWLCVTAGAGLALAANEGLSPLTTAGDLVQAPVADRAVLVRIGQAVRQAVDDLGRDANADGGPRQRLLAIQRAYLAPLRDCLRQEDPEIRLRAQDLLESVLFESRMARIMAGLEPDQREKLREFRAAQPRLTAQMFSADWSRRLWALRQIGRLKDPEGLAEPLVILSLRHPWPELVGAAVTLAGKGAYRSAAMVDALLDVASVSQQEVYQGYRGYQRMPAHLAALGALQAINSPRAAPRLAAMLIHNHSYDLARNLAIAEALAATSDKRVVPPLMKALKPSGQYMGWGAGETTGSSSNVDFCFHALLRLTGQSGSAYKFLQVEYYDSSYVGFRNDKDRQEAYRNMAQWWVQHEGKGPYAGLEPLEISADGQDVGSRVATGAATMPSAAATRMATDGGAVAAAAKADAKPNNTRASAAAAEPNLGELLPEVSATVRQLMAGFGGSNSRLRGQAERSLLEVHQAYLDAMIQLPQGSDGNLPRRAIDALGDAVAEAGVAAAFCKLSADEQGRLEVLEAQHPRMVTDLFSLSWQKRVSAVGAIGSLDDPNALAEPLLVLALRDSLPQITVAAAAVAARGKYRSPAVTDAMMQILLNTSLQEWNYVDFNNMGDGNITDSMSPHLAVLTAMRKMASPQVAPVLLALEQRGMSMNVQRDAAFARVLIATGEKRMIPLLLERLDNVQVQGTWSTGKTIVTVAPSDVPLMILVCLTGQDPAAYAFTYWPSGPGRSSNAMFGFKDDKDRKDAIAKFRDWWAQNRDSAEYRALEPLIIPALPERSPDDENGQEVYEE